MLNLNNGFHNEIEKSLIQDHKKSYLSNIYYLTQEYKMKFRDLKNANKNTINYDIEIVMQILIEMELFDLKKIPMIYLSFIPLKL